MKRLLAYGLIAALGPSMAAASTLKTGLIGASFQYGSDSTEELFCTSGCTFDGRVNRNINRSVGIGDRFVFRNADPTEFLDGDGDKFEVLFEVLDAGGPNQLFGGANPPSMQPTQLLAADAFVKYLVRFIVPGSGDTGTRGTLQEVTDATFVNIWDIDSQPELDFTDIAGTNLGPITGLGSSVESFGGPGIGEPALGFSFARMRSDLLGTSDDWIDEINVNRTPDSTASWSVTAPLTEFEFVWATQVGPNVNISGLPQPGPGTDGFRRGWMFDVTLQRPEGVGPVDPAPAVPLPASVLMLLAGVGGLAGMRKFGQKAA